MTRGLRILVMTTDAFGGRGGIAQYNQHLLKSLDDDTRVGSLVVLPRRIEDPPESLPEKVEFVAASSGGLARYALEAGRRLAKRDSFDLVVCGHLNLLPLATLAALRFGARLILVVYGIEVWQPPARKLNGWLLRYVDALASISATTRDRMLAWYPGSPPPVFLLPNAYDPRAFAPGPKPASLVERHGLQGRRNLLIFGRMSSLEGRKGFDEVLEATPDLLARIPDLAVILAGDGDDRPRLEQKAAALGIAGRVVFTGFVPEGEKADLYRLSDVCILPSRQEGFGFVLLEAMACGVPSIGSLADGSREAVLEGRIGLLVDPASREDMVKVVCEAMTRPRGIPDGLAYFTLARFQDRVSEMLTRLIAR